MICSPSSCTPPQLTTTPHFWSKWPKVLVLACQVFNLSGESSDLFLKIHHLCGGVHTMIIQCPLHSLLWTLEIIGICQEACRCDWKHEEVYVVVLEAKPVASVEAERVRLPCLQDQGWSYQYFHQCCNPHEQCSHLLLSLLLQDHKDVLCSSSLFEQRFGLLSSSLANWGNPNPLMSHDRHNQSRER